MEMRCGMRRLHSYAVVAAIFVGVLATPRVSNAALITFHFGGVLGPCQIDPNTPCGGLDPIDSGWEGQSVVGNFTFDTSLGTFTQFAFFGPINPFTWVGPVFPDPNLNDNLTVSFTGTATSLFARETLGNFEEVWSIFLVFATPLDALATSTLSEGYIARDSLHLKNAFISGAAEPQVRLDPEPSTILLMGTGLAAAAGRAWRKRKPRAPRSNGF